eukprot:TRINITY_DN588_c0_g1_i10.p1 TRINITY_DN588_c0_g1~~TRINITY_DN588_c0_g1_i10.p1  ORF type:complete len:387 (+),score=15.06 TRINITY_DN588_c0_g1_i10:348-1508(+)
MSQPVSTPPAASSDLQSESDAPFMASANTTGTDYKQEGHDDGIPCQDDNPSPSNDWNSLKTPRQHRATTGVWGSESCPDTIVCFHPSSIRAALDDGSRKAQEFKENADKVVVIPYKTMTWIYPLTYTMYFLCFFAITCLLCSSVIHFLSTDVATVPVRGGGGETTQCFLVYPTVLEAYLTYAGAFFATVACLMSFKMAIDYQLLELFKTYLLFFYTRNWSMMTAYSVASLCVGILNGPVAGLRSAILGLVLTPMGALLLDSIAMIPYVQVPGHAYELLARASILLWILNYAARLGLAGVEANECGSASDVTTLSLFTLRVIAEVGWFTGQMKILTALLRKLPQLFRPLIFFSPYNQFTNWYRMECLPAMDPQKLVFGTHDEVQVRS